MAKSTPVKTADNDYGIMFWGPGGPVDKDDGSELTIATASNHQLHFCESGNSINVTPKCQTEVVGVSLQPKTKDGEESPAKQILAHNGDIVISAKNGSIYLKGKNIYMVAEGDSENGSIVLNGNGSVNLTAGEQARVIGSKTCIRGEIDLDLSGATVTIAGEQKTASFSALSNLKSLLNGDFATLIEGIAKVCK
jgi:hypothetical protein|tara:strand:+ start:10967 stop:11548 length:582 start_codon:yes stop_codon:yes gene_type:complete